MGFQGKIKKKIKLNMGVNGLANGKILMGDANNYAQPVTPSGAFTMTNTGVATLSSDSVGNTALYNDIIQATTVTITNAQIKALRATPINLVGAPGAGYFNQFLGAVIKLNAGTNALTESGDNLVIQYDGGQDASAAIETTGFLDQTADMIAVIPPATIALVAAADVENDALELFNTGDGEIAGNAANDATLTIHIAYRIIAL